MFGDLRKGHMHSIADMGKKYTAHEPRQSLSSKTVRKVIQRTKTARRIVGGNYLITQMTL